MIIIGYTGVGKSTASQSFREVVDLQSTLFDDKEFYCDLAINLSKQDLFVCVSSHKEVVEYLLKSDEKICVVYPSKELKPVWVGTLRNRYLEDKTDENYKAMMRVWEHFDRDIDFLSNTPFQRIELQSGEFLSDKLIPGDPPGEISEEEDIIEEVITDEVEEDEYKDSEQE